MHRKKQFQMVNKNKMLSKFLKHFNESLRLEIICTEKKEYCMLKISKASNLILKLTNEIK